MENTIKKVISAKVAQPNTPQTDMQDYVEHLVQVKFEDGRQGAISLFAESPLEAIKIASTNLNYKENKITYS